MESEPQVDSSSILARQPSGIRALPSHDDDDDVVSGSSSDPFYETDNSPERIVANVGKTTTTTENSKNSNSTSNSSSSSSSFTSGVGTGTDTNGSFVSGEEEFETPMAGPDEGMREKPFGVAQKDEGLVGNSTRKAGVPIAKVSFDEDDDENEVVGWEEDGSEVGGEVWGESYGVENAPKVRDLGKEDDPVENGDEGSREEPKVEEKGVVADDGVGSGAEKNVSLGSVENGDEGGREELKVESLEEKGAAVDDKGTAVVEKNAGVELTNEGDAVVDSIQVDVGEAVRTRAAVVGVVEKEESEVKSARETSVVEESAEADSKTVEANEVKSNNEGKPSDDSTNVDVVGTGDAVAEEREERKDSEAELGSEEAAVVEEPASVDSVAVGGDEVKLTEEGDSVVDSIRVDDVEAVRSGVAVVGAVEERKDSGDTGAEVKNSVVEESAPVVEDSVVEKSTPVVEDSIAKESAPVVEDSVVEESAQADSQATETDRVRVTGEEDTVVDGINIDTVEAVRSRVAAIGDSEVEGVGTDVKEGGAPVSENVALGNEFEPLVGSNLESAGDNDVESAEHEQHEESDINEAEMPRSVQIVEPLEQEDMKPETKVESKDIEPADGGQAVSGGDEEKVQPGNVDEERQASSAVEGGGTKKDRSYASVLLDGQDGASSDKTQLEQEEGQTTNPSPEMGVEAEEGKNHVQQEEVNVEDSDTDGDSNDALSAEATDTSRLVEELERASLEASSSDPTARSAGQIVSDSEEEADSDEEGEEKELFDSAALAALLKAATSAGSDSNTITITSQDGSRLFSVERPAGLGSSLRSLRPASRPNNSSLLTPPGLAAPSEENLSDEEKKKLQHIHQLRVKFLRLVHRLGHTAEDSVAAQVLYRLALLAGRPTSPAFSLENAKQTAMQLEDEGKDDLDFALNILVLGKTGVGKSATINSIFGEEKVKINAFEPETTSVHEVTGIVDGVKIRVIDAPGLKSSGMEQGFNRKVLASVKKFTKKCPPDIMLYVDRLDSQTRDLNDLPMLRTITSSLGTSIWRSAIVTLTHAACAPPDGPSGSPLSYEVFVAQRSHIVQQSVGQAVGDLRLMNPSLMNPVSLVENHPACRKNREGQRVLPNGQAWRPQLLLLCYSLKILSEASSTSKPQDSLDRKLFGFRNRQVPLPYLLSTMLQSRPHPKLPADENGDSDVDLDDLSDSDQEEEDEYDQLPPFKPLRKSQISKLSRDQKKAYFEEYDYRVKLLQKKQLREELKRMREMKKKGKSGVDEYGEMPEDYDGENGAPAAVPVPLPDMVLPPSFDSDNPAYRYRFLEPTSQFLARPVLDTHGWDHDCGYDGVNVEQNLGIAGRFPAAIAAQVTKDKKEFSVHLDSAVSSKHGEDGSSLVGFDVQTLAKRTVYTVRGESKFKTFKKNKTGAGVSVTVLGEDVATGVKVEDQINLGKRVVLAASTGTFRCQKDAAYAANLDVRIREADYPIGQNQHSLALTLMKWRGDLAIGANLQSQISVGRSSKMAVRVSLNNKLSGQIAVRTSSSDNLQLALAGLIPIVVSIYQHFRPGVSDNYSIY